MTTFEKTWQTDPNRVPAAQTTLIQQGSYFLWYMKAILKNAGLSQPASAGAWTVYQSSDATAVGTAGDGIDRWTDTYTIGLIVRAAAGTAHSWIVLTKTIGGIAWYLTIDYAGSADFACTFTLSRIAPSGGTTLNRPTSATELNFSPGQFLQSPIAASKIHSNLATDGSFIFLTSLDGSGKFISILTLLPLSNIRAGDAWPVYFGYEFNVSGVLTASTWASTGTTVAKMRDFLNGSAVTPSVCEPCVSGSTTIMGDMGTTDIADGKVDDFPAWIYVSTVSFKGIRGRLPDVTLAPKSEAMGTVEPSVAPYSSIVIGNFWIPWLTSSLPSL